jgi:hypothetical protein
VDNFQLDQLILYTSDEKLAKHENIGARNIKPRAFTRSGWNNKEKLVDTYLVADVVETLYTKRGPGLVRKF